MSVDADDRLLAAMRWAIKNGVTVEPRQYTVAVFKFGRISDCVIVWIDDHFDIEAATVSAIFQFRAKVIQKEVWVSSGRKVLV